MKCRKSYIIPILFLALYANGICQGDTEPPAAPVFTFLTVMPGSGHTELRWQKSPSPDVGGYVVYYFRNGEGFAIDTLKNPDATSYINTGSASSYFMEAYVVAAFDYSGNISPLSNELHTIYLQTVLDSCSNEIDLSWNSYGSVPSSVTGYRILMSQGASGFSEAGTTLPSARNFSVSTFETDAEYCFIVEAVLESGNSSGSNKSCIMTEMQRAPAWINADYATVDQDSKISLSFTVDPMSEITSFHLQRKSESASEFSTISNLNSVNGKVLYSDLSADPGLKYEYRLAAINNCSTPVSYSNIATNLVAGISLTDNIINLGWNGYKNWLGGVAYYKVFIRTDETFYEKALLSPDDTAWSVSYTDIMLDIKGSEVCFYITATEQVNELNITGESKSAVICTEIIENIFLANTFTPNNDNINDLFKPVLSFTPSDYHFIVSDRNSRVVFESRFYDESWDGRHAGNELPQGVYLWFLKIVTPSGKTVNRSGTVTILR